MRRFTIILAIALVARGDAAQAQAQAQPQPQAQAQAQADALTVGRESGEYHLGDSLSITAAGEPAAAARKELLKTEPTRAITLYLDNVAMKGLPCAALDLGTAGVQLTFTLVRDANDNDNRAAWDALLKKRRAYSSKLPVSLAIGSALPLAVKPSDGVLFAIASPTKIAWTSLGALVAFGLAFFLLLRLYPAIFRDGPTSAYSLGKTQMVFWGLLVFFAVAAVFVVTGHLERIPPQTLTLLGISAGTGLGAALVTKSKQAAADARAQTLASEQQQLSQPNAAMPAGVQTRIDAITQEMSQLRPSPSETFLRDIMSDGNGVSFHRVQVVIWTLLLGIFFGFSVKSAMSLPEFPDGLLVLMGISNGAYLTLKLPEKS
jgi:hypothetical protein